MFRVFLAYHHGAYNCTKQDAWLQLVCCNITDFNKTVNTDAWNGEGENGITRGTNSASLV
jgi:hypothetical protein